MRPNDALPKIRFPSTAGICINREDLLRANQPLVPSRVRIPLEIHLRQGFLRAGLENGLVENIQADRPGTQYLTVIPAPQPMSLS